MREFMVTIRRWDGQVKHLPVRAACAVDAFIAVLDRLEVGCRVKVCAV